MTLFVKSMAQLFRLTRGLDPLNRTFERHRYRNIVQSGIGHKTTDDRRFNGKQLIAVVVRVPRSLRRLHLVWFLTDSRRDLTKWRFPNVTIQPDEYMVLLATGCKADVECSTDIALQTSFALQSREFLALLDPDGQVASSYGSAEADYPEQRADISYGLTSVDGSSALESLFMSKPAPGAANQQGYRGFAAGVLFGAEHGFYSQSDLFA